MKIKALFALACVSCVLFASSSTLYAESRPGALTVTLAGGADFFSKKRGLNNTGVGFLGVGYDFTKHWGIEALLGFFQPSFTHPQPGGRQINGTLFSFDGMYHFNAYQLLEPYVLAGIGVIGMNPSLHDANNETNLNGGLGVAFFIHPAIALRIEARDFYTMVGGKNDVLVDAGVTVLFDLC